MIFLTNNFMKNNRNFFLIFFILSIIFFNSHTYLFAQMGQYHDDNVLEGNHFSIKNSTGIHGGGFYTDIQASLFSVSYSKNPQEFALFPKRITALNVGIEHNYLFKNDFRLVPKISFDYFVESLLMFGMQTRLYPAKDMNFKDASIQVCPQVGISGIGIGYIAFGYNVGLNNRDVTPDLGFEVSIGINFFPLKRLFEEL